MPKKNMPRKSCNLESIAEGAFPAPKGPLERIEGLHVDVPSEELKKLLLGRLRFHEAKVKAYRKQIEQMRRFEKESGEEASRISKVSNASPVDGLESSAKRHENQCVYYKFVAEHLVVGAVYRLEDQDLVRLGIQADRY